MPKKTADAVRAVIGSLRKTYGDEAATLLGCGDLRCQVDEVIPTELNVLDYHILGVGGLPIGRSSEVYSEEGAGKTSLMLHCLAAAQKHGPAILIETENALQPEWAENVHGCDPEQLVLVEATTLEDTVEKVGAVVKALPAYAGPALVAWDSVASTPTKSEVETGETNMGERARILSQFCRGIGSMLKAHRAHLMFVNQVRERIGVMFGDKYVTPGGHALKFHASVRLQLFAGKAVKGDFGEHEGRIVTVLAAKNRLYPPWRKAKLMLDYATGWDEKWSTMALAKERKLIPPRVRSDAMYRKALKKLGWAKG